MKNRVSVALCTYNGGAFLKQQMESIVHQTYRDLEIIIVDDCSTDETVEIIKSFAAADSRIRYVINEVNLGYNKNFEKAFALCTSEYIAIADQDDIWELHKIEAMMLQWPADSLFVYSLSGNFDDHDFHERTEAPKVFYDSINDTRKLVFNSPVHGHACMFKKELLEQCLPFPKDIFYDWWMSMYAATTGTIGCIPLTLTWHRTHNSNSSRNITSIKDKKIRLHQLRQEAVRFIETFFEREKGKPEERKSLLYYASLLRKMDGKTFSWPMFKFILQNRETVFHYKKKPFVFISHLKHAFRIAYNGLL